MDLIIQLSDNSFDSIKTDCQFTLSGELNSETTTFINNGAFTVLSDPVSLSAGIWNFELQALKDGSLYKAAVENCEITSGNNTVTFNMTFDESHFEWTGSLSLTLTYKIGSNTAYSAAVLIDDETVDTSTDKNDTRIIIETSAAAGSHTLKVNFYDDSDNFLDAYEAADLKVYGGQTITLSGELDLPFLETVYSQYVSTQATEDDYGFDKQKNLPYGHFQFRGTWGAPWTGTNSNKFYDVEFAKDGSTLTIDGQVYEIVETNGYSWNQPTNNYYMSAILIKKDSTYLMYKYQYYYGSTDAPKGYVNFYMPSQTFTGTSLPASAPGFKSSRTYYPNINYSVLYT